MTSKKSFQLTVYNGNSEFLTLKEHYCAFRIGEMN